MKKNWAERWNSTEEPYLIFLKNHINITSHLRPFSPSWLFPTGLLTKALHAPLLSPICATYPAHLVRHDSVTRSIFGKECRSLSSSLIDTHTHIYIHCIQIYVFQWILYVLKLLIILEILNWYNQYCPVPTFKIPKYFFVVVVVWIPYLQRIPS